MGMGLGNFMKSGWLILFISSMFLISPVFAVGDGGGPNLAHSSSADLQPEWSPAGQPVEYSVTISNAGPDTVDEVRIYQNPQYTNFSCAQKSGWRLVEIDDFNGTNGDLCWYSHNPDTIPAGESVVFDFNATTPAQGGCAWTWSFETRDVQYVWKFIYDTTSVDDMKPVIIKTLGTPKKVVNNETWITQDTNINIEVFDQGDCGISGLDYCKYRYDLDGVEKLPWAEIQWDSIGEDVNAILHYYYSFNYNEDSEHFLEVRCFDVAGNKAYHSQTERVDSTPPETEKWFVGPQKIDEQTGQEWIDSVTTVNLNAIDPDPTQMLCNIGVDKTWYRNDWYPDEHLGSTGCYEPVNCNAAFYEEFFGINNPYDYAAGCIEDAQITCSGQYTPDTPDWFDCIEDFAHVTCGIDTAWKLYRGTPITKDEESCHVLTYFSVDHLGNVEDMNTNCFFVDKTAPEVIKEHGDGAIPDFDQSLGEFHWISSSIPITFSCVDPEPHPSGDEKFCFKVSYDEEPDGYLTDEYCLKYNGVMEEDWCCVDLSEDSCQFSLKSIDPYTASPEREEYYSNYGNNLETVGNPACPANGSCYEAHGAPGCEDETCCNNICGIDPWCCDVGWDSICVSEAEEICGQEPTACEFVFNFNENEDSVHDLEYYCEDAVEKKSPVEVQYYKVDDTSPSITKTMIGTDHLGDCPPQNEGDECYVRDDGQNGVHVEVIDGGEICASGVDFCTWGLWWFTDEQTCLDNNYTWDGQKCGVDGGKFSDYLDIYFTEDSTHKLYVNCWDRLGNAMPQDVETFLVDSTPPETTKTYGTPFVEDWFPKDCYTTQGPEASENPLCGWAEWITSGTPITLTATDAKVGVDKTYWRNLRVLDGEAAYSICGFPELYCNPDNYMQYVVNSEEQFTEYTEPFYKPEESCHVIEYYSVDKLGNEEPLNWQCVFVDNTAPIVDKSIGEPMVVKETGTYITQGTDITLSCYDGQPHPVDHVSLEYRYRVSDDCVNWDTNWTQWIDPDGSVVEKVINFPEDSCHELEYKCKDGLGNTTQVYSEIDIVDTNAPVITKEIVGPQSGTCLPEGDNICIIDGVTEIHVNAVDPEPHPVNEVTCDWDYEVIGGEKLGDGQQGLTPPFVINFPEESKHVLTITCRDALGNEATDVEEFFVDKTPPSISKEYEGPYYLYEGVEWINNLTSVVVTMEDPAPHPSGVNSADYRVTLVDDSACQSRETCMGTNGNGSFTQAALSDVMVPDSEGNIVICHNDHGSGYFVNLVLPPEGAYNGHVKHNSEPDHLGDHYGECTGNEEGFKGFLEPDKVVICHNDHGTGNYVNKVLGSGGAENGHMAHNKTEMHYGDHYGPCTAKQFNFTIPEESCHLIEVTARDDVNKTSEHKQCVFVDNTPPAPVKTVDDPKEKWDGADAEFYPEIKDLCWNGQENSIDCWKVTLLTPISLDCSDPDPHPVGHSTVCLKVELDGDDATADYCSNSEGINGEMNDSNYCCLPEEQAPVNFYFQEESEHNLSFYCEDALGNVGPTDDEKFKVEGTAFRIQLNKKWNLISVPFVLTTDIESIFSGIADKIDSVWGYDSVNDEWFVYRPDGPSNLAEMIPGWGYWVLAKEDVNLLIGGSLFSPASSMPSKDLAEGWNLIGYYGTDYGIQSYEGPYGNGKGVYCSLYTLIDVIWGHPMWTALYTYWEPYNPTPGSWVGLNTYDSMDPGAGYWVKMNEDGMYAPTEDCGWWD